MACSVSVRSRLSNHCFSSVIAVDFDEKSFFSEPAAVAFGARRLAAVSGEHSAVLDEVDA